MNRAGDPGSVPHVNPHCHRVISELWGKLIFIWVDVVIIRLAISIVIGVITVIHILIFVIIIIFIIIVIIILP